MSTRREREQRKERKRRVARAWAEAEASREPEAVPSELGIQSIKDINPEEVPEVVLYCRVSGSRQDLGGQKRGSRRRLQELGFEVVRCFGEERSGKSLDPSVRSKLFRALDAARKRGIPVVAPAISRFLRNADYHAHREPAAKPTVAEFGAFLDATKGVQLLTMNDPDADPPDDEAFLGNMAMKEEGRKVGRPRKKEPGYRKAVRKEFLDLARKLRSRGMSNSEIARQVSLESGVLIGKEAVRKWLI